MCYCSLREHPLLLVGTDMTLLSLFTEGELELLAALRTGLLTGCIDAAGEEEEDESE